VVINAFRHQRFLHLFPPAASISANK